MSRLSFKQILFLLLAFVAFLGYEASRSAPFVQNEQVLLDRGVQTTGKVLSTGNRNYSGQGSSYEFTVNDKAYSGIASFRARPGTVIDVVYLPDNPTISMAGTLKNLSGQLKLDDFGRARPGDYTISQ
jgi:hypothetical protein